MMSRLEFDAIGTKWSIDILGVVTPSEEVDILRKIKTRIDLYDKVYSRFRADSLVVRMSREAGTYIFPPDSIELFGLYRKFYEITKGKVTPLIGDVLVSAGYDAAYSLIPQKELRPALLWDQTFCFTEGELMLHIPTMLDIGAGGKGHLVDIIGSLLEAEGVLAYTIDAGGDIRHRTTSVGVLRVGLENPWNTEEVVGVAEIMNRSICGSSGNRRTWGEFHHIIDPVTKTSPRHIEAVWVVADSTFLADMLTTALFFVSPEILTPYFTYTYVLLFHDGTVRVSEDFPGEFFLKAL